MSLLYTIQAAIKTKLDADAYFADTLTGGGAKPISVIIHRAGDIVQEVTEAVGRYLLCVVVFPPSIQGLGAAPQTAFPAGPVECTLNVRLEVIENGVMNRNNTGTPQPGDDVAERIVKTLVGWSPAPTALCSKLHPVSLRAETESPLTVHAVEFAAKLNWKP